MEAIDIIQQQIVDMEKQQMALEQQADAILEQLTMTKGAVQILKKVLQDIELQSTLDNESQEDSNG